MPESSSFTCSVLMVAYNHESYISEAIEAIFKQTYSNPFELIIIDDCSTDSTYSIICESIKNAPEQIKVISHKNEINIGSVKNFNAALDICNGEYILVADGDDISLPERLERLVDLHQKLGKSLYITNTDHIDEHGEVIGSTRYVKDYKLDKLTLQDLYTDKTPIFGASYFFAKQLIDKYGRIEPSLVTHNNVDQNLFWRAWLEDGVHYVHESLLHYRIHDGGLSLRNKTDNREVNLNTLNKLANIIYLDHQIESSPRDLLLPKLKETLDQLHANLWNTKNSRVEDDKKLELKIVNSRHMGINGVIYERTLKSLKKLNVEQFISVLVECSQRSPLSEAANILLISKFKKRYINKNEILALMLLRARLWRMPYLLGIQSHFFILLVLAFRIIKLTKLNRSLDKIT